VRVIGERHGADSPVLWRVAREHGPVGIESVGGILYVPAVPIGRYLAGVIIGGGDPVEHQVLSGSDLVGAVPVQPGSGLSAELILLHLQHRFHQTRDVEILDVARVGALDTPGARDVLGLQREQVDDHLAVRLVRGGVLKGEKPIRRVFRVREPVTPGGIVEADQLVHHRIEFVLSADIVILVPGRFEQGAIARRRSPRQVGVAADEAEGHGGRHALRIQIVGHVSGAVHPDPWQHGGGREADHGRGGVQATLIINGAHEKGVSLERSLIQRVQVGVVRKTRQIGRDHQHRVGAAGLVPRIEGVAGGGIHRQGVLDTDAIGIVIAEAPLETGDLPVVVVPVPVEVHDEAGFQSRGVFGGDRGVRQGVGQLGAAQIGVGTAAAPSK